MEHIAAAEDFIRGNIANNIMKAPAAPGRDIEKVDAAIIVGVEDLSHKVQAPEPIKPTNRFGSSQGSIDHFVKSRAETEDFLKTTPGRRDHAVDSPRGPDFAQVGRLRIHPSDRRPLRTSHQADPRS